MFQAGRALTIGTLIALAVLLYVSDASPASLAGRFAAGQRRASRLQQAVQADNKLIRGFEGQIGNLRARLTAVERAVDAQELLLGQGERGARCGTPAAALARVAVRASETRARRAADIQDL